MTSYIKLTQGKEAIVDDRFFEELNKYDWHAERRRTTFYAARNERRDGRRIYLRMHCEVLRLAGIELGAHTDHRDGNGLNNRLTNIRPATRSQNLCNSGIRAAANRSGYKGVSFHKGSGLWRATIVLNRKQFHIGYYHEPHDAAAAYDAAAIKLHGEFARLNQIP